MADPDGIQMTEFGGPNEESRYADSNSARGIGFREGYTMQKGTDVALNSQARAKLGITAYDPSKPETANQWFTYGGKRYHYADNVPEIYNNARIDVFQGTYDISRRDRNVIGWKPALTDTNHSSTSLLTRFREDNPEFRLYSNESSLQMLQTGLAPGMDPKQFETAATSPNGIVDIQAYLNTPIRQLRADFGEEAKDLSDESLLHKAYDQGVANKLIDKDKEPFDDFKERFAPSQSWQAQTGRFVKQVQKLVTEKLTEPIAEVGEALRLGFSGTEKMVLGDVAEIHKQEARAALEDITATLDQIYPGQDNQARTLEFAKLSQPDAEAKLRQDIEQGGQELQDRLTQQGVDPARLFDRLDAGLRELQVKKANQDAQAWANKMVQKIDKENPGRLPENQEKVARMLNELPAQVVANAIPGVREVHTWAQLQRGNYNQIKQDHPELDERMIDARADAATGAQFPIADIFAWLMGRGGPEISAGVSGMILNQAKSLALTTGVGALTLSANQVITNIEDDKPPLQGVSDAAVFGGVTGALGHAISAGAQLSVAGLKRTFLATPQIRKAMGFSESVLAQDSAGMMRMVNGNGDSPVEKKLETNAIDMSINGVKAALEGEKEQESPVVEAFRNALAARESGDLGEAQKYIDQALALATPTQRDEINRHVAAQLRAVTSTPPRTIAKPQAKGEGGVPIEWKTLPRYQHKSSLPEGAETRVNPVTGETEYRVPTAAKKTSDQPVIDYFGLDKAPKAEEKIKPPVLEQKDHSFPSGHIQTRPDGQADLYLENGIKLTYPDVGDAIKVRTTIRSARGHKWEARSSGETIPQAELEKTTPVETAVPPKQEETPPVAATDPLVTYQPELNSQGQPTGRQIAFRDGKRIGVVNPKAPTPTIEPVTTPAPIDREQDLKNVAQKAIGTPVEQVGKVKGVKNWKVGDLVNVGFMRGLKVLRRIPTPGDYAPDQWLLQNQKGDYYLFTPHKGIQKVDEGMEGLGAVYNPFAAMRGAKRWVAEKTGWQRFERGLRKNLAPQRLSEEAADVAAMSIPLQTGAKTNVINQLYQLALDHNLNSVFDHAVESERREAYFNKETDSQLRQWVTDWATKGTTGNKDVDKFLAFIDSAYKFYTDMATKSKVTNGWLANLFSHAFKDRDRALAWYNEQIETTGRVPTFQEAIRASVRDPKLGLELRTYNSERLMLAHAATVMEGIKELDMMQQGIDEGHVVLDPGWVKTEAERQGKKISVPRPAPYGWTGKYDAADGKRYIMSPEVEAVLNNLFGPTRLYDAIDMLPGHFFNALKATLGAKLSWSQFHQVHVGVGIVPADVVTEYEMRLAKGLGERGETRKAFGSALEGYWTVPVSTARMFAGLSSRIPRIGSKSAKYLDPVFTWMIPTANKLHSLVDVMQGAGDADYNKLSQADKRNYHDLLDMGIVARPSHERYLQWTGWLAKQGKIGAVLGAPFRWGYNLITNPEFSHWYFGRVLPSLKIASALRKRDTVFRYYDREGINLRDPANAKIWRGEAAKINRDVEGRYGEMLYDNLLWNQIAKAAGVKASLSLGWGLGFWRMYGDAVQDFTDNAMNLDRIANTMRGKDNYEKEAITNRMLFAINYSAATAAAGITTSVVLGGVAVNALNYTHALWPQIGTDKNGKPIQIRPPFWTSEMAALFEGVVQKSGGSPFNVPMAIAGTLGETEHYIFNRFAPFMHTFGQLLTNKDWRGRLIADPVDNVWQQLIDWTSYGVKDLIAPIGVESLMTNRRLKDPRAEIAAVLGFGPDPAWVSRTAFENHVIYMAEQRRPFGAIGHREAEYLDRRSDYMDALESKDPQAISETLKAWQGVKYGITDREIKNARDEVLKTGQGKEDTALNMWKELDMDSQLHMLEVAPKEDFLKYFNHALKQTRDQWVLEHGPLTPEQLAQNPPQ